MSIVCEEIFDESSHPSIEEIKDYASKIGIDPDSEPHLLPLATEGLMKALPPDWKPVYDEKSKSYYYYNNLTKKTQWEHPLDDVYRGLVKKVRAESQSLSLNEPHTEDTSNIRDDIPSYEEAAPLSSKKLEPISLGARKKEIKLSPLKVSPHTSPKRDLFQKQRSEDYLLEKGKFTLTTFSSFDNDNEMEQMEENFTKHPQNFPKELKVKGGGSMFLKSNTKKTETKSDTLDPQPKSILRERGVEHSRSMEFDKLSLMEKSDKDDEEKKSVRFNLDTNNTDIGITLSDKSSSESEIKSEDKDIINVNLSEKKEKSRFTISAVSESSLKVIKPNPTDYIKPKLTISRGSDSDEDSILKSKNSLFSDSSSSDNPLEGNFQEKAKKLEDRAERKMNLLKQNIWEEKSEELLKFKQGLKESHKNEKERILEDEQIVHEEELKIEKEKLQIEFEKQKNIILSADKLKIEQRIEELKKEYEQNFKLEEIKLKEHFDGKKEELEKYYDEKLADIEKELADKVEKTREDLLASHNAIIEELKQNHAVIMDEVRRELHAEEQVLRQEHQARMAELKNRDIESRTDSQSERMYEKVRCEKRLLEDKYRCLKEKYLRLKTEVKMSIEKRNRRKEGSATTNTTGSETEQSHSNNKERTPLNSPSHKLMEKPPTPKHSRQDSTRKVDSKSKVQLQELDTSASDCYQSDANRNDSSDSTNHGRSRKKMFSRLKSSSTSRINNNNMKKKPQRSCSPVENLRRQLQKLEDLEDQFPQNPQSDTYHLRYPFSDGGQKFEGSSELEFFRHRIHLERDSIKRAKESLRSQKALFQQRQNELKLKHGSMARHTLQQLCQVALIFGIMGGCRRVELTQIKSSDIEDLNTAALIRFKDVRSKRMRSFTVTGKFYNYYKKYADLRPPDEERFFLNYQKQKCTKQPVGINKFGAIPKIIAAYLKLENPELYTGHCFRRSSSKVFMDDDEDMPRRAFKRHRFCKSTSLSKGLNEEGDSKDIDILDEFLQPADYNYENDHNSQYASEATAGPSTQRTDGVHDHNEKTFNINHTVSSLLNGNANIPPIIISNCTNTKITINIINDKKYS